MKKRSIITAIVFFLLIIPFSVTFSSGSAQAADKPETLRFGVITDMTGPYAPICGAAYAAFNDAVQYVNETGGIRGVPMELVARDSSGKVDVAINIYMQMREMKPRPSMICGTISGTGEALKDRLNEDKIPAPWTSSTSRNTWWRRCSAPTR